MWVLFLNKSLFILFGFFSFFHTIVYLLDLFDGALIEPRRIVAVLVEFCARIIWRRLSVHKHLFVFFFWRGEDKFKLNCCYPIRERQKKATYFSRLFCCSPSLCRCDARWSCWGELFLWAVFRGVWWRDAYVSLWTFSLSDPFVYLFIFYL